MSRRRIFVVAAIAVAAICAWLFASSDDPEDARRLDRVKSLPYLNWSGAEVDESERSGVVAYDEEGAFPGVNVLPFQHRPGGKILDMSGRELVDLTDRRAKPTKWKLIEPLSDSRFLILAEGLMLIDRDSEILWQVDTNYHHDVDFDSDGNIYTLSRRPEYWPELNRLRKTMNDYLVILDKSGEVIKEISFANLVLANSELEARARQHRGAVFDLHEDLFHANTVEIIPEDVYIDGERVFERGQVLTCWRNLDLVLAIDPDSEQVVWHWGQGELDAPHQPALLENGNLLIFDNGRERGYSRLIELNPLTEEIVWEYLGDPPESFFTASRGGAQRLRNGNTLITHSDSGEVIEIDASGEVVWRFLHPETERRGVRRKLRRPAIYRMTRLDPAVDYPRNPFESDGATNDRRLTDHPAEDRSPDWAPDGTHLLFASDREGHYDIYSIGRDGSELDRLTDNPASDRSPAWAPTGDRFVFESDRSGSNGLWMMDLESRKAELLFEDPSPELVPDWSPDGGWIAFTSERDGNPELYRYELSSGAVERLTHEPRRDLWGRYSPDGSALYFFSRRASSGEFDDLFRLELESGETTRVTQHPDHHDFVPSVSPDGRLVAGMSDREAGRRELVVFDPAGNVEHRFGGGNHRVFHPAWSPDGDVIAYAARVAEGESADLYLAQAPLRASD